MCAEKIRKYSTTFSTILTPRRRWTLHMKRKCCAQIKTIGWSQEKIDLCACWKLKGNRSDFYRKGKRMEYHPVQRNVQEFPTKIYANTETKEKTQHYWVGDFFRTVFLRSLSQIIMVIISFFSTQLFPIVLMFFSRFFIWYNQK